MDDKVISIPFVAFEAVQDRLERTIKRLWILCIITFLALVCSNIAWIMYETSFEYVEVTQDNSGGYNNFIGNNGNIDNGKTDN